MTNRKYYITMTDSFMSGWGRANNKINKLVFECDTLEQAQIVEQNARHRKEMKYINFANKKPNYPNCTHLISYKTIEDYPNWYKTNYFYKSEA